MPFLSFDDPAPEAASKGFVDFNAPPKKDDSSDFGRGVKESFQQIPQLGYGLLAGGAAAAESAFGEGGLATGLKKAAVRGYEEWGNRIASGAKESDSWSYAYDEAKNGNFGALVDWLQHGLGYVGGQAIQTLATAGVGAVGGKVAANTVAKSIAEGMVAKEAATIAAASAGKELTADQVMKAATANVAAKFAQVGQTAAVGASAVGMEGGEIFGDLSRQSVDDSRSLSGAELGKAFAATLAAGGLEFVGDKIGLDLMLGRSALLKPAAGATGLGGRAARAGIASAGAAPIEGATEYAQTLIEEVGKGKDASTPEARQQALDAAALGVLGGGATGFFAGGMRGPRTAVAETQQDSQPTLQLGNTPDPFIYYPDGTVGRRSEVDAYVNSFPEDQRIAARSRLMGMEPQSVSPLEQIQRGETMDQVLDATTRAVMEPLGDLTAALDRQLRDPIQPIIEDRRARSETASAVQAEALAAKEVELDAIQREAESLNLTSAGRPARAAAVERAATVEAPSAMRLAMQRAREKNPAFVAFDPAPKAPEQVVTVTTPEAKKDPQVTWFGRRGDGYVTQADAAMALPSRRRNYPDLEWAVEQMPTGKFRLAGYAVAEENVPVAPMDWVQDAINGATDETQPDAPGSTGSIEPSAAQQPAAVIRPSGAAANPRRAVPATGATQQPESVPNDRSGAATANVARDGGGKGAATPQAGQPGTVAQSLDVRQPQAAPTSAPAARVPASRTAPEVVTARTGAAGQTRDDIAPNAQPALAPEVSRYTGKFGKGMGRDAARLEAARLSRQAGKDADVTYAAEEHGDAKLENEWAVIGRSTAKSVDTPPNSQRPSVDKPAKTQEPTAPADTGVRFDRGPMEAETKAELTPAEAMVEALQQNGFERIRIARQRKDLPPFIRAYMWAVDAKGVRGLYDRNNDMIWLMDDAIGSREEAMQVAMHEAFHRGLLKTFPDVKPILNQIYATNQSVRDQVPDYMERRGIDKLTAIEEVLADMAGEGKARDLNGWDKLVAFLKDALNALARKLDVNLVFTDAMVEDFVAGIRRVGLDEGVHIFPELKGETASAPKKAATEVPPADAADAGIRFSQATIVSPTTRKYTAAQKAAFRNVGFEVDEPTLVERAKALWADAGKSLAQGIVDQFAPIKELGGNAYTLMRLSKGASGAFEAMLRGGRLKLTDGVYDFDEANKGGVVDRLLIPLQGEHQDFFRWIAANRAERLKAQGKENLFSDADIAALKSLAYGTTEFDYTIKTGPAKGKTTRNRTEVYADSQRVFNEFNRNVLDMAEQSGLIDGDARKVWESEFYVPFYRVAEDGDGGIRGANVKAGVVRQQAFKALKGGKGQLNADLLDNTLMNWAHLLDASAKNRAAKATLDTMAGLGKAIEAPQETAKQMGASINAKNGVVWYMEQGEKRFFLVEDKHLLTAVSALEYAGMRNPVMNAMSAMKHALTVGVTASPYFKIRNLIRDSVQVIGTSNIGANPVGNIAQGWKLTDPKSDAYFRLLAGGGTIHFGTMLEGSEAKRVAALVESGVDQATILDSDKKVKAFYRKFVEPAVTAYNELGNRGEAVNRAALYDQLVKQGMSHADASLQARDLMDFSMQGSFTSIRFLTQVVPFFNARLQGLYKLGRAAKEDPARFSAVLGATAMFSLALLAAYGDDDDWKKRTEQDRNNFWWFKFGGQAFRIPKPFEIGSIATLAERGFELFFDKEMTNERFRKNLLTIIGDNLSMNPVPQLVKPILDIYSNKDYTGRPIESLGMERLKSEYRFNDRTSMIARGASTGLNSVTGLVGLDSLSPVQIDHMLRGYFGWLGSFVVGAADTVLRPATSQPNQAAPDYWKTITGNIVSDLRDAPSRYVNQVYEQAKEVEEAYGTYRQLLKEGKTEEAREFRDDNADKIGRYRQTEAIKKAEAKLNERRRIIERSNMTPDQKRDLLRVVSQEQDRIARGLAVR